MSGFARTVVGPDLCALGLSSVLWLLSSAALARARISLTDSPWPNLQAWILRAAPKMHREAMKRATEGKAKGKQKRRAVKGVGPCCQCHGNDSETGSLAVAERTFSQLLAGSLDSRRLPASYALLVPAVAQSWILAVLLGGTYRVGLVANTGRQLGSPQDTVSLTQDALRSHFPLTGIRSSELELTRRLPPVSIIEWLGGSSTPLLRLRRRRALLHSSWENVVAYARVCSTPHPRGV
ncbi:hypothetical protein C8R45DRAFT_1178801 [Mycena sanguinolenta]|nr:hypothetical protein C8R45DRAFT_1178801 [Mycena sanguinolenta]